jgi:hypothetical protein
MKLRQILLESRLGQRKTIMRGLLPLIRRGTGETKITAQGITVFLKLTAGNKLNLKSYFDPYGIISIEADVPTGTPANRLYSVVSARLVHELTHVDQYASNPDQFNDYPAGEDADYETYRSHPTELTAWRRESKRLSKAAGGSPEREFERSLGQLSGDARTRVTKLAYPRS